ncbi:CRISPR-associated protein, TM1812 family [Desulfofarcimen acetoxidans DSM 771]|uniref:CRISPR-associated protein, TM1812 family n=1 Tax=Desulfofarcimen acetoxidans (strain ATCC 49208 / DSM 771 / KCTC 5769 / VKM B-1644 / 5575) TaxID=485916 RepID=C8W3E9_DESAS|nr:TIGR02221 family CRISPR-associated protein [Desulfofarcimen acetoxidans]ACV63735.1 CRISPR-associated protein, TM1812 family [Desulfofarcimen acetoxidans DSM 771]
MCKLITFIGTGKYEETTYIFDTNKIYTRYFSVFSTAIIKPVEVLVVRTEEAANEHWGPLCQEFLENGFSEPVPIDVPEGKSTKELWEIFNTLIDKVDEQDSVVFDITHGFRSLSLVCFLSIAYLKFVKNVQIKGLYYGAYEARDKEKNITPVFDLTDFCSLLDWIVGVNSFIQHGSAREISSLLVMAQKKAKEKQGPARRELNSFGMLIEDISRALFTTRPFELVNKARNLKYYKEGTEQRNILERDVWEWAAPFGVLMDKIIEEYYAFAGVEDHYNPLNLERHLAAVRWYVEHNYAPQALSMMRELVISFTMCQKGEYGKAFDRGMRELTAGQLYRAKENSLSGKLWSKLSDPRNDVIHAGWRTNPRSSHKVMQETSECLALLEELFSEEGLIVCHEIPDSDGEASNLKVLITPLGMSPGLLYTAINHIEPDRILVLTSKEGRALLTEITTQAGYSGGIEVVEVKDPFAGFNELSEVIEKVMGYLEMLPPHKIYINLAGGTTLLQYITTRIAGLKVDNCEELVNVVMIDKRPVREQQENPYVMGDMLVVE